LGKELKRSKTMDRLLVVVFDAESEAYEGKKALHELDKEDVITVFDQAVVARNADGSASVRPGDDLTPVRTLGGALLGALIGLLGGPVGVGLGAAAGIAAGAALDVSNAQVCEDFVEDVREKLTPEKFAVVAEISEDSTTPVDTRMEALGGTVYRRALKEVKRTFHDDNVAAMKADRAQLTAERAKASADRKVKLQQKIDELDSRIAARLERAKQGRQAVEGQEKAKAEFLEARAAVMKANAPKKHVGPPA
jgi:uncharacterized membrane protein